MKNVQEKQKRRIFGRSFLFIVLFIIWAGNAVLRLLFGYMAASGVQLLDISVAQSTLNALVIIFLFLGASGVVVAFGLWQMKRWGLLGTIVVALGTIVFDIWGMTIQYTAAMGFVVPTLVLIYLVMNRRVFLQISGPSSNASMTLP
ncbi:MAG: hypothetical protein ACXADC_08000 [Candidatus Thorarchaeota archaeon]|jgi:uncharacterized membrane protein (DUF2068 family)